MNSVAYECVYARMPQEMELLCRRQLRSHATIYARGWHGQTHEELYKNVKSITRDDY